MKYAITHCYTDHNKGDAAIIISTTQLIRNFDDHATINMFSTFGPNDEQFHYEHDFVKKFSDNMYPGIFYQPRPVIGKSDASRFLHLIWISLKFVILLISKNSFFQFLFFTKLEREGLKAFLSSDVIISKGGSYITSQNKSLRQSISLFSMLYPFLLAKRYGKKMYIFSQSLGPVVGKLNQWLTKKALSDVKKIFLREDVCLNEYDEIRDLRSPEAFEIIPDSAFYLLSNPEYSLHNLKFDIKKFNVGLTIVDHAFKYISDPEKKKEKIDLYKKALIDNIEYLVQEKNALVHIFPQVISNNSHLGHSDVRISREIENICAEMGYGEKVTYHYGDFNPMQLKNMYSKMDIFIGTRLHSVIFALSSNVPSINIAYHGTKSQGILKSLNGFKENVISIDEINTEVLKNRIDELLINKFNLRAVLQKENLRLNTELEIAINKILKGRE